MEQTQLLDCIDVRLVKEQLRLLGHDVTDDVIFSFVKGLAGGGAAQYADGDAAGAEACQGVQHTAAGPQAKEQQQHAVASSSWKHPSGRTFLSGAHAARRKAPFVARELLGAGSAAASATTAATAHQALTDVPSRLQQADQHSPKRAVQHTGSPAAVPQASLDQRCRKFLARLADREGAPQQQLVSPGARSRASLAELSDFASDGDQEQADDSPLPQNKEFGSRDSMTGAAGTAAATHGTASSTRVHDEQHLTGAVCALHINGKQAQQPQQQLHSSREQPTQQGFLHSVLDAGSDVVFEVQPGVSSSDSLPRFGFRPGYRPVGIHMPPPPGQEALALMQQTNGSRSIRAGDAVARADAGRYSCDTAAASGPLESSSSVSSWLTAAQQPQSPQQLLARLQHHVVPARASPGLRASSDSIIGDAITGGGSSCYDRPRRVSKDGSGPSDPLYHAPASPTGAAGASGSIKQAGIARSPAADRARALGAGSSKPRSLVFEHASAASHSAGREVAALPNRQSCSSRATTNSSSRSSVAASAAGGSSYGGVSSGGSSSSAGSSVLRYSQQLSWSSGRSTAMAPGVRRTDRVARFQRMQQAWQKDRYLNTGGTRIGTAASTGGSRPAAAQQHVRSKPTWED